MSTTRDFIIFVITSQQVVQGFEFVKFLILGMHYSLLLGLVFWIVVDSQLTLICFKWFKIVTKNQ